MKFKHFYSVGHITNDLEPYPHLSGSVAYSALMAKKLGLIPHVITKIPATHSYLDQLKTYGINVYNLPVRDRKYEKNITSFRNYFNTYGKRKQIVSQVQEQISLADLQNFPAIKPNSIIFIAPVLGEVCIELFRYLAERGVLAVTTQGYYRHIINKKGEIERFAWKSNGVLKFAQLTTLSKEDITFYRNRQFSVTALSKLVEQSSVTVLTEGKNGATIYKYGRREKHINAFPLKNSEIADLSGVGDIFSASFIIKYLTTEKLLESAIFATLTAAIKTSNKNAKKENLEKVPNETDFKNFVRSNKKRVNQFLKEDKLSTSEIAF